MRRRGDALQGRGSLLRDGAPGGHIIGGDIVAIRICAVRRARARNGHDRRTIGSYPVRPAPVDRDRAIAAADDQLGAPVAVQVGGRHVVTGDRQVEKRVCLERELRLPEQSEPVAEQERDRRSAGTVDIANRDADATGRGQVLDRVLAPAALGAVVDDRVHIEADAIELAADDEIGPAVAVEVGHRRRRGARRP